jgi:hypothetical protein
MTIPTAPPGTAGQAAPLDALLADAALGTFRRFTPDASAAKFAAALARRPHTTGRRLTTQSEQGSWGGKRRHPSVRKMPIGPERAGSVSQREARL